MTKSNDFVADGYERAKAAVDSAVRAEVHAEYAARLREVSFFGRLWLRREIRREIERRIEAKAPPHALY